MDLNLNCKQILDLYSSFKNEDVTGRFLSFSQLHAQLKKLDSSFIISEKGRSFLDVPILSVKIGKGKKRILAWSQMHGNETTSTKAILDLFNLFSAKKGDLELQRLLEECTLLFIPMLNPDGAARYTRENVNKVDLNRDAFQLSQPESRVLRKCFDEFQPSFCFNLHDQRTIFGVGESKKPSTMAFLAPSCDEERSVGPSRLEAIKIIAAVNEELQKVLPGQIARFDDAFNLNCTGDFFQSRQVPTILFEAGHFQQDYMREKSREFFVCSVLLSLKHIVQEDYEGYNQQDYLKIPENRKSFLDVILRNCMYQGNKIDVGIQYVEKIKSAEIIFLTKVETMAPNLSFFGHKEIECHAKEVKFIPEIGDSENDIVNKILLNGEKLSINP